LKAKAQESIFVFGYRPRMMRLSANALLRTFLKQKLKSLFYVLITIFDPEYWL